MSNFPKNLTIRDPKEDGITVNDVCRYVIARVPSLLEESDVDSRKQNPSFCTPLRLVMGMR